MKKINAMNSLFLVVLSFTFGSGCSSHQKVDDTLHFYVSMKIKTLDPQMSTDTYSSRQIGKIYSSLYSYHYLKRPYEMIPALAEKMPSISKDEKTYTIKIKKGILFQDDECFKETQGKGRELTAEDVVYSWKRLADTQVRSPNWWLLDGKVLGLNEWREKYKGKKANYDEPVAGLKAIDRYTVQIKLIQPSMQFIYSLAMDPTSPVAREAVEFYGSDFSRNPVGTGPFQLVRSESNFTQKLVFVANPNYRDHFYPSEGSEEDKKNGLLEDAGKKLPLASKVVVDVVVEDQPRWLNFMKGRLDFIEIPKDNYAGAVTETKSITKDLADKGMSLAKDPMIDITHESFNMADPVVGSAKKSNKYLRQALSLVWDSSELIDLFYNGRAIPAQSPVPPGIFGYDRNLVNEYRKFDVEKAKKLMKKAGYPNGKGLPEIRYSTYNKGTSRQMSEYLKKSFARIGVKLRIDTYTWPEFLKTVKNRKSQMHGFAWRADYPDAENFLQLFYGKNASPGSNDSNFENGHYDRLYEKLLVTRDRSSQKKIIEKMQKILIEEAPWIFGVHRMNFTTKHGWLKNYKFSSFDKDRAMYMRVDLNKKKELLKKL